MLRMQDRVREIALDIVCADGRRVPALVNSVLERDASGAPHVIRTAIFDATERREYERELLRAKQRAEDSEAKAQILAQTLQQTLIPPAPPSIPGLDIAAAYRPAGRGDEIGGDFYDIFEIADGDWVVAVGDVCGKGVDAAVVTAVARYTIRAAAVRHPELSDVLDNLNAVLLRDQSGRFCTVALARLRRADDGTWAATVATAGHPPVLLAGSGAPVGVGSPGTLLGVLENPRFPSSDLTLTSGQMLVLYTDGVTEARRGRRFFGEERLAKVVTSHAASAHDLVQAVLADVMDFQGGHPRDDIVIVAARVP